MSAGGDARFHHAQSLALHAVVAARVRSTPEILERARHNVDSWLAAGAGSSTPLLLRWRQLLAGSPEEIVAVLTDPSEAAAELRKASPFAGVLSPRERESLLRQARLGAERVA